MFSLLLTTLIALEARAFTERFTCARQGASFVNVTIRGRGRLPVTRSMPVTAKVTEVKVGEYAARDVVMQGWANLSASGTFYELDAIHADFFRGLVITSFGPAALVDLRGERLALDCGNAFYGF